jgi:2'-5' RNA ligase
MRLFIAINFPADVRTELWNATSPLRESSLPVRWVGESEFHLTLKFLGETKEDLVGGVVSAIRESVRGTKSFVLPVGGFGAFPSLERPRVFWVGCDGVPSLELIQHGLELGTERVGFPVEGRPFRPHLTLGRVKKDANTRSFKNAAELVNRLEFQAEPLVESIDLMESRLSPRGATYRVVESVPVGTGPE